MVHAGEDTNLRISHAATPETETTTRATRRAWEHMAVLAEYAAVSPIVSAILLNLFTSEQ